MRSHQFVLLATALILAGVFCLRPPAMPRWDTTVVVPLYQSTFRFVDFLDTSRFQVNPDSSVTFAGNFAIDTVSPSGVIDLLGSDETSRIGLADFVFPGLAAATVRVGVEELIGRPIPDSGVKLVIPGFERSFARECALEGIEWAEVVRAVVTVKLSNHTGLAFDSAVVALPFGRQRFGSVAAGRDESARLEVGGAFLGASVPMTVVVGCAGTSGDTVRLTKHDSLSLTFVLDSVQLAGGRVRLPEVEGRRWCTVGTGTTRPFKIDSLTLAEGTCRIEVTNDLGVPLAAVVRVPGLDRTYHRALPAHEATVVELDLAGTKADNRGRSNCLLEFEVQAAVERVSDYVDLNKTSGVRVRHHTHSLKPLRVAGRFTEPVYAVARLDTLPGFFPAGMHGLRVPSAELVLDLDNSIGFPLDVRLELAAVRNGAAVRRSEQTFVVPAGAPEAPAPGEWVITVTDLVNAGPDFLTLRYTVRLTGQGSYEDAAWLAGRATMSTPLRFAFEPDTITFAPRTFALAPSHRDAVARHFVSGTVYLTAGNHFPIGFGGWLDLTPDSTSLPVPGTLIEKLRVPFLAERGRIDRADNCVGEVSTSFEVELDSVEATLLRRSPLAAQLVLCLPASDTMNFRATDRLRLSARMELNVRVE